jgi:hypothetical protein
MSVVETLEQSSTTAPSKQDDDGFTTVESKFKYKITPKKKNHKKKKSHFKYQDPSDWTLDDIIKQLESYR